MRHFNKLTATLFCKANISILQSSKPLNIENSYGVGNKDCVLALSFVVYKACKDSCSQYPVKVSACIRVNIPDLGSAGKNSVILNSP